MADKQGHGEQRTDGVQFVGTPLETFRTQLTFNREATGVITAPSFLRGFPRAPQPFHSIAPTLAETG